MSDIDDNPKEESKPKLLMIDDSKLMRKSAVKMLGNDFEVLTAESGEQGLAIINNDPDLQVVFTDINMPGIDGYEVLKEIRTHSNDAIRALPVVVVTGAENDDQAKEEALSQGATDFITKPFNSTDLRARALAHANFRRTARALEKSTNLDALTELGNQQFFEDQLHKDISFISRHNQDLAVVVVEIYDFKNLFLKIGRQGADSVVRQIAKVLKASVRKEDTVARLGLARFAMSLPTAKPDGAVSLAQRICEKIAGFRATLKGEALNISVSMGVFTLARGSRPSVEQVIQETEGALQDALAKGPSRVVDRRGKADESQRRRPVAASVSVDQVLDSLAGATSISDSILEDVLSRLTPLWSMLSPEQKAALRAQLED